MIKKELFGTLPCGCEVYAYTLSNGSVTSAKILNYGGIIANLWVQDKNGNAADVVCGFDTIDGYLTSGGYQGALIGRTGNRIGGAKFTLEGKEYHISNNEGENSLHGGHVGFDKKIWSVEEADGDEPELILSTASPDGEEGFPGTLHIRVTYTLTEDGSLAIHYEAVTDKTTIISMTNHAYFNLAGYETDSIDDHIMWLKSDRINSVDGALIPDGTFIEVAGTPFDFNTEKAIGHAFADGFGGYDHNYVFSDFDGTIKHQATLKDPKSGRTLKLYTDRPCVQIYTANAINSNDPSFKNDVKQMPHCAVCLETQAMPDSINHEGFTNVILKPDEKYDTTTIFVFEN